MSPEWGLFVDESGTFADAGVSVLVAGLLLRTDVPTANPERIEGALRAAMPDFPWPIHAAHIAFPVTAALAHCAQLRIAPTSRSVSPADDFTKDAVSVVASFEQSSRPGVREAARKALKKLVRGKKPRIEHVRILDKEVEARNKPLHDRLQDHQREAVGHILELIRTLTLEGTAHWFVLTTVLSGEAKKGDAIPPGAEGEEADTQRYYALLECLLGRTYDLLERFPGRHAVHVHVCTRDVSDPRRGRVPLDLTHLKDRSDRVVPPSGGSVRLLPVTAPPYASPIDARLVLVDFVANQARRALSKSWELRLVYRRLRTVTIGELRSGSPPLSHVAASGWAREHVEAGRRHAPSPPPPAGIKAWAREQAEQWAAVLGSAR
jgi:hypothetical protein